MQKRKTRGSLSVSFVGTKFTSYEVYNTIHCVHRHIQPGDSIRLILIGQSINQKSSLAQICLPYSSLCYDLSLLHYDFSPIALDNMTVSPFCNQETFSSKGIYVYMSVLSVCYA